MSQITKMLKEHPSAGDVDLEQIARCAEACCSCAGTCTVCADACLGEERLSMLVQCIRVNLNCADICTATGRMLVRMADAETEALRNQVQSCMEICRTCAAECDKHASRHKHCKICAEECRNCEDACKSVLGYLGVPV